MKLKCYSILLLTLILACLPSLDARVPVDPEKNYSLWPRRPVAIEDARLLLEDNQPRRALSLLLPYISMEGIVGRDARYLCSSIMLARYFHADNPHSKIYTVRPGDQFQGIANRLKCPADVLMLTNGLMDASIINIGQKLRYAPMALRLELHLKWREVLIWDDDIFIASYPLLSIPAVLEKSSELIVKKRIGYHKERLVNNRSPYFIASARALMLSDEFYLAGESSSASANKVLRMEQKDINELSLLIAEGARVSIIPQRAMPEDSSSVHQSSTNPISQEALSDELEQGRSAPD